MVCSEVRIHHFGRHGWKFDAAANDVARSYLGSLLSRRIWPPQVEGSWIRYYCGSAHGALSVVELRFFELDSISSFWIYCEPEARPPRRFHEVPVATRLWTAHQYAEPSGTGLCPSDVR